MTHPAGTGAQDNTPITALPPLRDVISAHGLAARKGLGQHFLLDLNLTGKIARLAAPLDTGTVIEIGPGPGGLTRALLLAGARNLVAVEKDERCIAALQPLVEAAQGRLALVSADALKTNMEALGPAPRRIVANLPYNVGTPLLISWLRQAHLFTEMTLMFQKEVAERIVAQPGESAYGRLSVICNWRCRAEYGFTIPARAFTPPPKIDSAVVSLRPYDNPPFAGEMAMLERVTAAAFGQRRKTLRRALRSLSPVAEDVLSACGIDGGRRAETLSVTEFGTLAAAFAEAGV